MRKKAIFFILTALLAIPLALCFSGWTGSGEATLDHSGKATAELIVESEEDIADFTERLNRIVGGYNDNSGDDDFIKVTSVNAATGGYRVGLKFRRIDKVKAMGDFGWNSLSTYVSYADNRKVLENFSDGNWGGTWSVYYEGKAGSVQLARRGDGQTQISPRDINGNEQEINTFLDAAAQAKDADKMFMCRLVDVGNVTSLKITFPGTIRYYAGNSAAVVGKDTIELKPSEVQAQMVVRYKMAADENGEESLAEEILVNEPINAIMGYVVYEQSLSPSAIAGIVILSVIVVGGIAALAVYFTMRGKKVKAAAAQASASDGVVPQSSPAPQAENITDAGCALTENVSHMQDEAAGRKGKKGETAVKERSDIRTGIESALQSKTFKNIVKCRWLYLIILPAVVLIFLFCYLPMAGIVIAFQDFNLLEGFAGSEWVGFKAFELVFVNPSTANYMAVRNTIYIAVIRIASNFPVILIFALLLHEISNRKARSAVQAISYIPAFISWIAVGGLANNLFTQDGGALNKILASLGLPEVSWYNEPDYWWAILSVSSLWKGMGWGTLIYMSAMGAINSELYDACLIDGGGRFRQMTTVTIPGISNVIMLQLLLDVASIVRDDADQIMAMTNSSPALDRTTAVIGTTLISTITGGGNYASATALGIVQGLVGLVLVLVMNSIVKKTECEGLL